MAKQEKKYAEALTGKDIPILTLDNKWTVLFPKEEMTEEMSETAGKLNELMARRGQLNTEMKKVKQLKRKLLDEIPDMRHKAMSQGENSPLVKKLDEYTRLINECNEKIEGYENELIGMPNDIYKLNYDLMMESMVICYQRLHENSSLIGKIDEWLDTVRVELKRQIISKQESEIENFNLYSYMHQIFGVEVIDLFDMQYDPEQKHPIRTPNADSDVRMTD